MVADVKQPLSLPPLENGDRPFRDEFERRYQAMPQHKKIERRQLTISDSMEKTSS